MKPAMREKIDDAALKSRVKARREEIRKEETDEPGSLGCVREIGAYADQDKLTFLRKYLYIYAYIITNSFPRMWYVETCAGPGICRTKRSGRIVLGSPLLALTNEPHFTGHRLIEYDPGCVVSLEARWKRYVPEQDVKILQGDCNVRMRELIADIPENDHFFAFMDPEGLELKWDGAVMPAAERPFSELYINFTFDMAIKRNISPQQNPANWKAVTEYMGTDAWVGPRDDYEAGKISFDQLREAFLQIYEDGLRQFGFKHFAVSRIVRSDNNQPLYCLLSASRVDVAKKTMDQVMRVSKGYQAQLFES